MAGILVAACYAGCLRKEPSQVKKYETLQGCYYEEKIHPLGSKWRSADCLNCTCDNNGGMECCPTVPQPYFSESDNCEAILNKTTCKYDVKQKGNTSCEVTRFIL
ncbi:beta-microseminoprotein-like [Hyperolius riggenbachi]|uniref:beta-microseminoprotein-like n=1 Tax=Hyperolius riggenbachi TaxID=752182 RepID=UPI0035A3202D